MNFNVQALDHYYLCGVDGVGFCCVIFAAEILADWLENSSMCVSGIHVDQLGCMAALCFS